MGLRSERRRGRRLGGADLEPDGGADPAPGPADLPLARESQASLHGGLRALRPEERHGLERCGLGGQSYAAYGREFGLHTDAVKSRAFRARRRLRERIAEG